MSPEQYGLMLASDSTLDGPSEGIGYISSVSVDDVGRIFVADQNAATAFGYSPQGKLLQTVGRAIGGPIRRSRGQAAAPRISGPER